MLTAAQKEANQRYRETHKEKLKVKNAEYSAKSNAKHKEKRQAYSKEYYEKTKGLRIEKALQWNKDNPMRILSSRLKRDYGITVEAFYNMLDAQDLRCAICLEELEITSYKHTHVDHCHSTGIVRGILCGKCNRGLGLFQDSVESLTRAVEYLSHQRDSNPHLSP